MTVAGGYLHLPRHVQEAWHYQADRELVRRGHLRVRNDSGPEPFLQGP